VLRAPVPAPCPPSTRPASDLRCGARSSCSRPLPGSGDGLQQFQHRGANRRRPHRERQRLTGIQVRLEDGTPIPSTRPASSWCPRPSTSRRSARAYLVTDDDVARVVAHYAPHRPEPDDVSRATFNLGPAVAEPVPWYLKNAPRVAGEPEDDPGSDDSNSLEDVLWEALCNAPEDGADVAELMRATSLGRSTVYKYLAQLSEQGRAIQLIHRFIHGSRCSRRASNV